MQYAIAHYRKTPDGPLLHHVETASDQATALQAVLLLIPANEMVSITLGTEAEVAVLKAARAVELASHLCAALEQATAALPDAWKAVDCNVPVELIKHLQHLQELCRAEGFDKRTRPEPKAVKWTVVGGDGDFDVCAVTGRVLTPKADMPESYQMFSAVDVEEYRAWCISRGLCQPATVDICAVRLYDDEQQAWSPAEEDAREMILQARGLA